MSTCHVAGVIWILKASIGVITWFGCSRKSLHWNDSCPRLWPCRKRWRWRSKYPTPYKKEIDGTRLGLGLDMRRTKLQYQYAEAMQKCVATEGRSYQWQISSSLDFLDPERLTPSSDERGSHTLNVHTLDVIPPSWYWTSILWFQRVLIKIKWNIETSHRN